MVELAVGTHDTKQPTYGHPDCHIEGAAETTCFHPDGGSLWLRTADLVAETTLTWGDAHGDEAVYVLEGSVSVDDRTIGPGGVVVVEAGVPASVRTLEATELVHVGPSDPVPPQDGLLGPAKSAGRGSHVVPAADAIRIGTGVVQVNFADSTCPTCRIALFRVDGPDPYVGSSHVHSEDEIIHVISGSLQIGRQAVGAGMSVAIPADRRYGFRTKGGFSFLNYRRDVSTLTMSHDGHPWLETVESLKAFMSGQDGDDEVVAG